MGTGVREEDGVLKKALAVCIAVAAAGAISACGGGGETTGGGGGGGTIDIYSSLPLQGASSAQTKPMVNGIKLALDQAGGKAGDFTVKYESLDDSTAQAGEWDPGQTAANARKVAADPSAVYYIGEFNSGASEVSIPILNNADIPQVSPANTYVGLTTDEPGSAPGEPDKYYPTGTRTYLRIVPRDSIQAAADLQAMEDAGCTKVAMANDKEAYGAGLADLIELEKGDYDLEITSNTGIDPKAANFRSYAQTVKGEGADCFFFAGIVSNGAVQLTKDINAALPDAGIFGADGVCTSSYTSEKEGGVPATIAPKIQCTVATLDLKSYPGGKDFLKAYEDKYGEANPDPYAIYGYEAMKLGLDTIADLGADGNDKSAVLDALFATQNRKSVLGTYGFDDDGDTTLTAYGLYKVDSAGNPVFFKTLKPSASAAAAG
jgi:branched-chain amino acid transport system substrate-binding protein